MRNKILLELHLPAAGKQLEIRVPRQMKVAQVTGMLIEFLQKGNGEYIPNRDSTLCEMENGNILDSNAFIDSLGLQDGARLMLV